MPVADRGAGPPTLDAVIVGLDFDLSYDRLRMAVTAVRNGARFIGTNHDPTYPTEHGLWAGGGSIVAAVHVASETEPAFAGKPVFFTTNAAQAKKYGAIVPFETIQVFPQGRPRLRGLVWFARAAGPRLWGPAERLRGLV